MKKVLAALCIFGATSVATAQTAERVKAIENELAMIRMELAKAKTDLRNAITDRDAAIDAGARRLDDFKATVRAAMAKVEAEVAERDAAKERSTAKDKEQLVFDADRAKAEAKLLRDRIDKLEASLFTGRPIVLGEGRKKGDVVHLNKQMVTVLQVLDNSSMLVVVGAANARDQEVLKITDIDTSEIVDHRSILLAAPIRITGTYRYDAINGGTKTIWAAEYMIKPRSGDPVDVIPVPVPTDVRTN